MTFALYCIVMAVAMTIAALVTMHGAASAPQRAKVRARNDWADRQVDRRQGRMPGGR